MEFGIGNNQNGVILAVSRTSDPTGTWDKYFIDLGVNGYLRWCSSAPRCCTR